MDADYGYNYFLNCVIIIRFKTTKKIQTGPSLLRTLNFDPTNSQHHQNLIN